MLHRVCFSTCLRPFKCWRNLSQQLDAYQVPYSFLEHTADVWVRDFMPVSTPSGRLVQFVYEPDYLADLERFRTDPAPVTAALGIAPEKSDLKVDGGNVIRCDDCVIMTDKVLIDNPMYSPAKLIAKLEKQLEAELVLIPRDPEEPCGHSDGMVRYMGHGRLLVNHYTDFDPALCRRLRKALSPRFDLVELHFGTDRYIETSWAYLNYLQVADLLFVPACETPIDDAAFAQIESAISCRVVPVVCGNLLKLGGALNCISWEMPTAHFTVN